MDRHIVAVVVRRNHRLEVDRAMGDVRSRDHAHSSHEVVSDGGSCHHVGGCSHVDHGARSSRLVGQEGNHDRYAEESGSGSGHVDAPLEAGRC